MNYLRAMLFGIGAVIAAVIVLIVAIVVWLSVMARRFHQAGMEGEIGWDPVSLFRQIGYGWLLVPVGVFVLVFALGFRAGLRR